MQDRVGTGSGSARTPQPRKAARIALEAEVLIRRAAHRGYRVTVQDISPFGCKLEFVERPRLDERVWVKFDGLEALEAMVCWIDDFVAGVEFEKSIHAAVFAQLLGRLNR